MKLHESLPIQFSPRKPVWRTVGLPDHNQKKAKTVCVCVCVVRGWVLLKTMSFEKQLKVL